MGALKEKVRGTIRTHAPSLDSLLVSRGLRKHFRQTFKTRQDRVKRAVFQDAEPRVLSGPFAGMTYLDETVWGPIEPKWFGTYEAELHKIIKDILRTSYTTILDVGSAEGFYSVGFARLMPRTTVHSFDVDPWARAQQRRLASLNDIDNLQLGRRCGPAELDALCKGRTLVICDIEGHEYSLLDPEASPKLRGCDILVETHPDLTGNLTAVTGAALLAKRFEDSHQALTIGTSPRPVSLREGIEALSGLSEADLTDCLDERRSFEQRWLWLQSRRSPL